MDSMSSKLTNALVCGVATAVFAFVLGFALGNVLGLGGKFELDKWQSLVGAPRRRIWQQPWHSWE